MKKLLKLEWLGTVFLRTSLAYTVDVWEETLHRLAT